MRYLRTHFLPAICSIFCLLFMEGFSTSLLSQDSPPNILFAIADDWSYGHASAYDCKWVNTPNFDEIAKKGLLFHRAYTPNAKCAPSRACILTGRNSWQLKAACNHVCEFPPEFKTYPEALRDSGYVVGVTGKGWGPGRARTIAGGNRKLTGTPYNRLKAKPPAGGISNNDYSGNFKAFLKDVPRDKPWCFWYGTVEPHRGYEWQVGIKKGGKKLSDIDRVPGFWPDNETTRTDMLDYAFEVEHFDLHLGRIIDAIKASGQFENTIIVVTSDHGMPFPRCKGQAYDYSNHVPLAISWPKGIKSAGRKINDYVSFVDLAPTFAQAARIPWKKTGMQSSPGKSLFDLFQSEKSGWINPRRDHVLIGKERHDIGRPQDAGYPIRGIIKKDRLLIHNYAIDRWPAGNPETGYLNCDGSPTKTLLLERRRASGSDPYWDLNFGHRESVEFFDLKNDADCVKNLAGNPSFKKSLEGMRQQMVQELTQQGDLRMIGKGDYYEKIPYIDPKTTGFYERFMKGDNPKAGWVNPSDFEKKKID